MSLHFMGGGTPRSAQGIKFRSAMSKASAITLSPMSSLVLHPPPCSTLVILVLQSKVKNTSSFYTVHFLSCLPETVLSLCISQMSEIIWCLSFSMTHSLIMTLSSSIQIAANCMISSYSSIIFQQWTLFPFKTSHMILGRHLKRFIILA